MENRHMRRAAALSSAAVLACLTGATGATEPAAGATSVDGNGQCTFPMKEQIKGTPWSLQRLVLDRLWEETKGKEKDGEPVKVAVIDTGVDNTNVQLKTAVDASSGANYLAVPKDVTGADRKRAQSPTYDEVGHGTKVAGIIAARPRPGTGFVGLAPDAKIIPLKQNNAEGKGTPQMMARAIRKAVDEGARVINISQDTKGARSQSDLELAVAEAIRRDVVVVASAGNDGADGKSKRTYPASYRGVLAVAASDRNNERAYFSQSGDFVGVAAPGVEMVSTVPKGGQCVDNGTSFAAPYVAGVAALIRAKHPDWNQQEVVAQIEQTAERGVNGRDRYIGWGVIDPVKALTDDEQKIERPSIDNSSAKNIPKPDPGKFTLGETPHERSVRLATYALGAGVVVVAITAGGAIVLRDWRRRRET
jgi:membrane-anchored mycosin MYCP